MERLRDICARARGAVLGLLYGIDGGAGLRIGKDVILSRRTITAGERVRVGDFSQVSGRVVLGSGVYVHRNVIVRAFDGQVEIGEGTTVNPFSRIYGKGGVRIGRFVSIAPGVTIVAANKIVSDRGRLIKEQGVTARGITIEDDVWIAANATILDGVTLREGCVIGAGAVVNRDVEAYDIVAGVPARVIGHRGDELVSGGKVSGDSDV